MTNLGNLHFFLGVVVRRTSSSLFIRQQQYATEIIQRVDMQSCNPCATPIDTNSKLLALPEILSPTLLTTVVSPVLSST